MFKGENLTKASIVVCPIGIFSFTDADELIIHVLFAKDPFEIAKTLKKLEAGQIVPELVTLLDQLRTRGYSTFLFENSDLAQSAREELTVTVDIKRSSRAGELVRRNLERFAIESGFLNHEESLDNWIHKISMALAKLKLKDATAHRDLLIIHVIQTIDDLDKTINLFVSRIREWYSLHFPELTRLVSKYETYMRLIVRHGRRIRFSPEVLRKEGLTTKRIEQVLRARRTSIGAEFSEEDIKQLRTVGSNVLSLSYTRDSLTKYLEELMEHVAPNTNALVGSLVGARLIALAGSLENLAKLPASTIQVLGAEKALFRSLKTGSRPPKHGIIFQHSLVHDSKRRQRGKIARALAGKLAIAARIDAFQGEYVGDKLKASIQQRVKEINEKYRNRSESLIDEQTGSVKNDQS